MRGKLELGVGKKIKVIELVKKLHLDRLKNRLIKLIVLILVYKINK